MDNNKTIIQAHPGFSVIFVDDDKTTLTVGEPIVAWAISRGHADAVTTDGLASDIENLFGYLTPAGEVIEPYGGMYSSLEAAQKKLLEKSKLPT